MRDAHRRTLLLPGVVVVLVFVAWAVVRLHGPALSVGAAPPAPAVPVTPAAPPVAATAPAVSAPAETGASSGGDAEGGSLADLLEAQAGQLADLLSHMRATCAATQRTPQGALPSPDAVSACVQDAAGAMSLVEVLRGTIASPAGQTMPGDVRDRWGGTLAQAAAAVRDALAPVWQQTGQALASGQEPPDQARALGHLRDRIGGVLSRAAAVPGSTTSRTK
jgi:hypothetical protein